MIEMLLHFWDQGDFVALFCIGLGLAVPIVYFVSIINTAVKS